MNRFVGPFGWAIAIFSIVSCGTDPRPVVVTPAARASASAPTQATSEMPGRELPAREVPLATDNHTPTDAGSAAPPQDSSPSRDGGAPSESGPTLAAAGPERKDMLVNHERLASVQVPGLSKLHESHNTAVVELGGAPQPAVGTLRLGVMVTIRPCRIGGKECPPLEARLWRDRRPWPLPKEFPSTLETRTVAGRTVLVRRAHGRYGALMAHMLSVEHHDGLKHIAVIASEDITGQVIPNGSSPVFAAADQELLALALREDGRTRLGYKAEHVVDLDTGAVVAVELYPGDQADTATLERSLETARENIEAARSESADTDDDDENSPPPAAPTENERPTIEVVADKGYHKVELVFELGRADYRTYIPAPDQKGKRSFIDKGGMLAREAFHNNRARVRRAKGKELLRRRGERIERTFAHACETGAHRRLRLRGRDNARKRYLIHVAALNLALLMRTAFGYGTPRQAAAVFVFLLAALRVLTSRFLYLRAIVAGTLLPSATSARSVAAAAA